jgi:membrane protease YdiL (CAAX protease family)
MSDPIGGPNPLLPAAAFGCSIVWCYLRYRTDRLAPSVLSHAIFSWAVVEFPLWRP